MGVRRRLLRELLASLKYIKNLTEQQIQASILRGQATLQNLQLEPRELQKLFFDTWPCGIELLEANVDEVCVRIPWRQIMTQSVVVVAKNVEIRAVVHCEDEVSWREVVAKLQRKYLQTQLERVENAPFSILSGPTGAFDQMRQRMTDGMQIQVNRVSLSILSCHARHFPMHGPAESGNRPLAEALRVVGEDIMLSPCDSARMPTDKLKAMAVYIADNRQLQLTKFMKCRAFWVSPGRCPNPCPYAAADFMENPVPLTCHVCQKYASDGYRLCPFPIGNALDWEFGSTLGITVCECQLRSVFALIMDISRLEEWRLSKELLKEKTADASPEKSVASDEGNSAASSTEASAGDADVSAVLSSLEGTSDALHSSAAGSETDLPDAATAVLAAAASAEAAVDALDAADVADASIEPRDISGQVADASVDADSEAASEESDGMCSCDGYEYSDRLSSHSAAPGESHGASADVDAHAELPADECFVACIDSDAQEAEMQAEIVTEPLVNTSSVARTLARGSEPRKRPDLSLSSAASMLGLVREVSPAATSPTHAPAAEPLMDTTSVARVFAKGPADRPERRQSQSNQEQRISSSTSTQSVLTQGAKLWKKVVPLHKVLSLSFNGSAGSAALGSSSSSSSTALGGLGGSRDGPSLISSRDDLCETPGSGAAWEEAEDGEAAEDGDDEEASGGEEELGFYDAEDYFSVASSESGAALEDSASAHTRWLKPMLKWFGTSKPIQGDTDDWPEMSQVVKAMSIAVTYLTVRLAVVETATETGASAGAEAGNTGQSATATAASIGAAASAAANADPGAPVAANLVKSGHLDLCLDGLFWRTEVRTALPAAHLECIQRLARPADERSGLVTARATPAVGPWCLPILEYSAQSMKWPLASVTFTGTEDSGLGVVELLQSCDAERQVGSDAMIVFNWQPREAPPVTITSSTWVLRTWPMEITFHRASIIADAQVWTLSKRCYERVKPFFLSKFPSPSLLPPQEPQDSGQLFPTESLFMEFVDCEIVEPRQESTILKERRWPLHVTIPNVRFRSNSSIWDFSQLLAQRRPDLFEEADRFRKAQKVDCTAESGTDGDVTIPIEMFDQLVHRAADATLQRSQVKAAREELQAAYIKLAATRATSATNAPSASMSAAASASAMQSALGAALGGALGFGSNEPERTPSLPEQAPTADSSELERLRRKCAQLESSLQSQGLAQRRLEAELENYKTLARDELRQVLFAKTHAPYETLHSSAAAICSAHA